MATTREETFDEMRPTVTDLDVETAARAGKMVASWNAFPRIGEGSRISFVAIKFALTSGAFETVILDRYGADVMRELLNELDKADWRATQSIPPGQKPN